MKTTRAHFIVAAALGGGLLLFGTAGYMILERWPLLDAFYMTVITLATVGFSEIHRLDASGRVFTIILIGAGVFTIAFTVQIIVRYIVEENIFSDMGRKRMSKRLARLKDHIIVCGHGRIGMHVAESFRGSGLVCVVVDKDVQAELSDEQIIFVSGDATDEQVLLDAGVERARCLVTAVGSDADNLFITLSARGLCPKLRIISRATDARARAKLLRAGADSVVLPYEIGGRRIAGLVLNPALIEFLDMTAAAAGEELHFEEVAIGGACWLCGRDIMSADIRRRTGVIVLAVKRAGGPMISNPGADLVFESGDHLLSLGTSSQIDAFRDLAALGKEPA